VEGYLRHCVLQCMAMVSARWELYSVPMKPASRFTETHKHCACAANHKPIKYCVRVSYGTNKCRNGEQVQPFKHAHPGMLPQG
jgi:hypothetical protein